MFDYIINCIDEVVQSIRTYAVIFAILLYSLLIFGIDLGLPGYVYKIIDITLIVSIIMELVLSIVYYCMDFFGDGANVLNFFALFVDIVIVVAFFYILSIDVTKIDDIAIGNSIMKLNSLPKEAVRSISIVLVFLFRPIIRFPLKLIAQISDLITGDYE